MPHYYCVMARHLWATDPGVLNFPKRTIKQFGLKDTPTAFRSPWQNPICERVIGTLWRQCLDHIIVLNEKHLRAVLDDYINNYYNVSRTHMSLGKDAPVHREVQAKGKIASRPINGGLHHVYRRVA
ncbi:MAG: transposase [Planctomycetes bacterium]|nr:transposase [Planctomycetota bacterium]